MSSSDDEAAARRWGFRHLFSNANSSHQNNGDEAAGPSKWSMGMLNDRETVEVPGSVLLLAHDRNEPLGLRNIAARTSHSSIPTGFPVDNRRTVEVPSKKTTQDGTIILDPQPDDSNNDPLNWPSWQRDVALLSLGFYCMIGGGITPLIAAGFNNVAQDYDVSIETVALTTGFCMMGLGIGAVFASPTAILYGKRPVYLFGAVMFIGTAFWAAFSPNFTSLLISRIFMGISISPVECLPSATIAEIFFLHERAYRIGIYTLLLLSGKNMLPLIGAAIIGRYGWRWAFIIVAIIVAFGFVLLFLFVPETFWDRTPTRRPSNRPSFLRRLSSRHTQHSQPHAARIVDGTDPDEGELLSESRENSRNHQIGFVDPPSDSEKQQDGNSGIHGSHGDDAIQESTSKVDESQTAQSPAVPRLSENEKPTSSSLEVDPEVASVPAPPNVNAYTHDLRQKPARSFAQQLRPFHGRLNNDNWFKVLIRPFILYAYPAVLWSSIVYSCSIGWLIVMSENMAIIYRNPETYNFTALQTGMVYFSPFIGAILGTGVAGKLSDILVRAMSRRNGGLYEPEFRLIMVGPVLITTCIGLMGFGWSAQERDAWIVPTVFFGIISFGCSLGSTTSITFCVDSYRQYAGEALVTLNFTKNIVHGLVFSLFVSHWLHKDGPKTVYIWIGVIQLIVCLLAIPMYIFGKRARMWTARKNFMENF